MGGCTSSDLGITRTESGVAELVWAVAAWLKKYSIPRKLILYKITLGKLLFMGENTNEVLNMIKLLALHCLHPGFSQNQERSQWQNKAGSQSADYKTQKY